MRGRLVLALAAIALSESATAGPAPYGLWRTADGEARVSVRPCVQDAAAICGVVAWLAKPTDPQGTPIRDSHNPDPALKRRPVLGIGLFEGLRPQDGHWGGGTIYDPKTGRTYRAGVRLLPDGGLELKGCFLVICRSEVWRRAD